MSAEELSERVLRNELGLQSHEKECALRYGHINETMTGMHRSVSGVRSDVTGIRREIRTGIYSLVALLVAALAFLIKLTVFK
jgi:hypothetical protein